MTIAALLRFVDEQTKFPIHIDTIIDWIKDHGLQDEIELCPADLDSAKLLGMFYQYIKHPGVYADPVRVTQIVYAAGLSPELERLVVCKELLHIFDKPEERVQTSTQVDDLISGIILRTFGASKDAVFNDVAGPFLALAVLIPPAARKRFMLAIEGGQLTADEVASFVNLPYPHVSIWLEKTVDELLEYLLTKHKCADLLNC
ncbi:MAG: hypothetical protein P4L82_06540 [Ancalomicrobiaceae bacterium]|nr:hypothetical protein [Ancalomicrobiaceae bacterium]